MKTLIFLSFLFSINTLFADEASKHSFELDGEPLPTIEQHLESLQDLAKEDILFKKVEGVEYKDEVYSGLEVHISGISNGTKVEQKITYINLLEGLYRLIFIKGKRCVRGTVLRDGEWVTDWVCDEAYFPLRSEYGVLYLLENLEVDTDLLSEELGKQITAFVDEGDSDEVVELVEEAEQEEVILSLADIENIIKDSNFSWVSEETIWVQPGSDASMAALAIRVKGMLTDTISLEQEFIYIYEGDFLKLKSIDGKRCEYVERVEKEICSNLYSPTNKTPFPLTLRNSTELTTGLAGQPNVEQNSEVEEVEEDSIQFKCGSTAENYGNALRYYFEGSSLAINDISNIRKVFSNFPKLVDPDKVLLSDADFAEYALASKEPYIFDSLLEESLVEILKGVNGNCDSFLPYIAELKEKVLYKKNVYDSILKLYNEEGLKTSSLTSVQQELIEEILKAGDLLFKNDELVFLDIALGSFGKYIDAALNLLDDEERFLVSAVFKQDAYSGLLVESQRQNVTSTFNNPDEQQYFGVTFRTGINGSYILSVHPDIKNVVPTDEIISLNGRSVKGLSHAEVDAYFLDSSQPLDVVVKRAGEIMSERLVPVALDISKAFYDINEEVNDKGSLFVKISLRSFPPGIAESLFKSLSEFSTGKDVSGYVLDLSGNRGGSAEEAFKVASIFVKDKNLGYYSIGYRWSAAKQPIASSSEFFLDDEKPLIVLVNQQSQSAAEALAASLDALNRSYTVGEQTFGKQVAQDFKAVNLSNGDPALAYITTSEYLDASGRSLNGIGLTPSLLTSLSEKPEFDDGNSIGRDYEIPAGEAQEGYAFTELEAKLDSLQDEVLESGFSLELLLNKL